MDALPRPPSAWSWNVDWMVFGALSGALAGLPFWLIGLLTPPHPEGPCSGGPPSYVVAFISHHATIIALLGALGLAAGEAIRRMSQWTSSGLRGLGVVGLALAWAGAGWGSLYAIGAKDWLRIWCAQLVMDQALWFGLAYLWTRRNGRRRTWLYPMIVVSALVVGPVCLWGSGLRL
ncbi:MAG: hypothetical protein AAGA48_00020 [Myxococcota bacterium]